MALLKGWFVERSAVVDSEVHAGGRAAPVDRPECVH